MEEAEYEFQVSQVDMLKEVQEKRLESVTLEIPIEHIDSTLTDEIAELCQAHKGQKLLRVTVYDEAKRHSVTLRVQGSGIEMNHKLYHELKTKEADGVWTIKVAQKG